jgi:hypothetical protein
VTSERRKFKVIFEVEIDVEVDDDVVQDALSDEFKASYYKLDDAAAVAHHLAYNFVCNRAKLSSLDGFAHWTDRKAKLAHEDWTFVESTGS